MLLRFTDLYFRKDVNPQCILCICSTLDVNFLCLTQASSLTDLARQYFESQTFVVTRLSVRLVSSLVQTNKHKCYFRKDVNQVCILCICSTLDVNFLCLTQASSLTDLARQYFESQTFVVTRLSVGLVFSNPSTNKLTNINTTSERKSTHCVYVVL